MLVNDYVRALSVTTGLNNSIISLILLMKAKHYFTGVVIIYSQYVALPKSERLMQSGMIWQRTTKAVRRATGMSRMVGKRSQIRWNM